MIRRARWVVGSHRQSIVFTIAICALAAGNARGQGGPPMITDDPGTPGNGKFEINLAIAFERRPHETSWDLPVIDINYGVGENIQLTLQTAPVLLKRSNHGPMGGLGGTEAAVKWRFVDEDNSGVDVSMFPRIIFNVAQSSVRRGLSEDGTRFQIPFQAAKQFGPWHIDGEFGPLVSTVGRSEWIYGVVGGLDVAKTTMVIAELHARSRMSFSEDTLIVNVGLRHELAETRILIISLGHELRAPADESLALIGYFGVQFLY
jgi:hypothetical protein